jgi:hypothetical protein
MNPEKAARPSNHDRSLNKRHPRLTITIITNRENITENQPIVPISKKKPAIPEGIADVFRGKSQDSNVCEGGAKNDIHELMHVVISPFSNLNLD